MKFWVNYLRLYTTVQDQPSNIREFLITNFIYNCKLKMEAEQSVMFVVLSELMDSDDEILAQKSDRE